MPLELHRHNANFKGKLADATPTAANSPVYAATVTNRCGRVAGARADATRGARASAFDRLTYATVGVSVTMRMAMENLATLGGIKWVHVPHRQLFDMMNASSSDGIGGPKGMDPKLVKLLHDTFRKGLDDAEFLKLLDRYDTMRSYMNTEDYTRWAREQYVIEKTVVEKFA